MQLRPTFSHEEEMHVMESLCKYLLDILTMMDGNVMIWNAVNTSISKCQLSFVSSGISSRELLDFIPLVSNFNWLPLDDLVVYTWILSCLKHLDSW